MAIEPASRRPLPPPDRDAHEDGRLMHDVAVVNTELGRYVLRFLDADAGRSQPLSTEDERALAARVAAVAQGLRVRAERRDLGGDLPPLIGPISA